MLSEIFPGSSPKIGSTYWDQIEEVAIISVIKRILQRLRDILDLVSFYFVCDDRIDHFVGLLPCLSFSIISLSKVVTNFDLQFQH